MVSQNTHPYVEHVKGVCGGKAVIKGTRMPVWAIVECYRSGLSAEEIQNHYPHLSLSRIFDALGYADDHVQEIERDLKANQPPVSVKMTRG